MAIFDELGKKISGAGQGVAQQTRNLADITHLNSAISAKEKQLPPLFTALGKAYYERHRDDAAPEDAKIIEQISTLYKQIADCQEKVLQIKGARTCPDCGAEVPVNAAFCNACGTKMPVLVTPAIPGERLCPNCKKTLETDSLFCVYCGTKIEENKELVQYE